MIAIMCETPFQLLNALNIAYTNYKCEECMLFITEDMFKSNKKFTINSCNNYIKKIFKVKRDINKNFIEKLISKLSRIILGYDYIRIKKRIPDFKDYKSIDKIICIKYSDFAFDIYNKVKKEKNIEINIIEEGIGEYLVSNGAVFDAAKLKNINKLYLMSPKFYKLSNLKINIEKVPYLNNDKEFKEILDNIFQYKKDVSKFKNLIYFGQAFASDYKISEFNDIEENVLEVVKKHIKKEQTVIKLHPRSNSICVSELTVIDTLSPWECNVNEMDDIENRVIMSISSTAIITPKLLCNKEPYVICTVKIYEKYMKEILKEYNYYNNLLKLLENVKKKYKNEDKFFMPATIEELEEILIKLKGEKIL